MRYLSNPFKLNTAKTFLSLSLLLCGQILSLDAFASEGGEHKIEVHCKDTLKTLKKKDLCGSSSSCSWTALSQSETASVWSYNKKQIVVREVPNRNMLRISFKDGARQLKMPWCPSLKDLSLSGLANDSIKESGEVQYIIAKKENAQLRLLKTIDNICRRLKTNSFYRSYKIYHLEASDNPSCKRVKNNLINRK